MNEIKQIFLKMPGGNTLTFDIDKNTNVADMKRFIFKRTNLPSTWQRFVLCGKGFYENNLNLITDLGISKENTIWVFIKFHGVGCRCPKCFTPLKI